MMPIDYPPEMATPEELQRWLRSFIDEYNRLVDRVNAMERKGVNENA